MKVEFFVILKADDITDQLADSVYEAGFDDCSLIKRSGAAAIWIRHRPGELKDVMGQAVAQAQQAGLSVAHIEIENAAVA